MLVIEAQFVGRPIVAFDIAAAKEQILEGKTGFLVEPKDTGHMKIFTVILKRK